MPRNLSSPADRAINYHETSEVFLTLLTIDHVSLPFPLRFVNNTESVLSRGNSYLAFPFQLEFPGQDDESPGEARLEIDNIDRAILKFVREISGPPTVAIEVVLASSLDIVEAAFPDLKLRNVTYDAKSVSGVLKYEDIVIEPVTLAMTPQRFPGQF